MTVCATCGKPIVQRNAGARRLFCSERCRKRQYQGRCVDCGKPTNGSAGRGPNAPTRCPRCSRRATARRQRAAAARLEQRIIDLRAEGLLNSQIAAEVGSTVEAVATRVYEMRRRGIAVPTTAYRPAARRRIENGRVR